MEKRRCSVRCEHYTGTVVYLESRDIVFFCYKCSWILVCEREAGGEIQ